ncbi:MAG: hypothetical protein JKY52_04645 [Flavobacteriales bacterium]|nr:hypothetical protein [Flavobacteriales bacterium]
MIKLSIVVFAVITALASTCNQDKSDSVKSDSCLETLKAQLLEQSPQLPASSIWEYTYKGSIVYLVPAPCCDNFNPVYNLKCEVICHPHGGITGKGDGKCNDFRSAATGKKLVWKDSRSVK